LPTQFQINFTLHRYAYDPDAERIGRHAAEAIGIESQGCRLAKVRLLQERDQRTSFVHRRGNIL
jgi:hypothetical protein